MATLLISDIHLKEEQPETTESFRRFLAERARDAEALFILGDLFEAWIGDDDLTLPFHAGIAADLKRVADHGVRLYFLPGNRDFLVGADLARAAGLTLLPDPTRLDMHGTAVLLAHGDAWCIDDVKYQAVRSQIRNEAWCRDFLAKPLPERRALAAVWRAQSEMEKAGKDAGIMDVNAAAITDAYRSHQVCRIIHGHTHRPARHREYLDNRLCERWVLPDWRGKDGGYLVCDEAGCRAEHWE